MFWKWRTLTSTLSYPLKVAISYAIISGLWIFLSDRVLLFFSKDIEWVTNVQTIKGFCFILLTTIFIFLVLYSKMVDIDRSRDALERTNRALRLLLECNKVLLEAEEEKRFLTDICKVIVEVGGYRFAWVGFARNDRQRTVVPVASYGYEEDYLKCIEIRWDDSEYGMGPTGRAIKEKKPVVMKNLSEEVLYKPWRELALKRGYHSSIALPLIAEGAVFGALNIYSENKNDFDDYEIELLKELASNVSYGIKSLRDYAMRKQFEAEREQLQKMELVGQMAGGIAHDFNNIITVIKGSAEYLKSITESDDQLIEPVEEILVAVERATSLVKQLMTFSKKQEIQPEEINVNEIILGLKKILPRLTGNLIKCNLNLNSSIPRINGDPVQIQQIIYNLVVNARDSMEKGGVITIETDCIEAGEEFTKIQPGMKSGLYVLIKISDTGAGIPDEIKNRIFEPFFTTKGGKGTGLGLATVFSIVKRHNGHINFESTVGKGTTFNIYLPAMIV